MRNHTSNEVGIYELAARLDDPTAIAELFDGVPDADVVRSQLPGNFIGLLWDDEQRWDYWLLCNKTGITRLVITGLTIDQARHARNLCRYLEGICGTPTPKDVCALIDSVVRPTAQPKCGTLH